MLNLYNTYTRKVEEFQPRKGFFGQKPVTFYSCGPTVYNYAHIGNLKKYLNDDTVVRSLKFLGYKAKHVTNITDVGHLVSDADEGEDKMVKGLKREGLDISKESMLKLARIYTEAFFKDLEDLNIIDSDAWPKATDYVAEMINIVSDLIKKGIVYETSTAFYYDTTKFPTYSKLGNLTAEDNHGRIEEDPEKKHPHDFAVWMKAVGDNANHVMVWDAPFSKEKGFPGWHIECSAMSLKLLGETIDLHSGGVDHIKVHHSNEIAQSEAYTGKQFVRYWLHYEFVNLNNTKMAKSGEGFIQLKDLKEKGFDPLSFRFLTLMSHYRTPMNFSLEALESAQNGLNSLRSKVAELGEEVGGVSESYLVKFKDAISDDLNTSSALSVVYELLKDKNISNKDKKATILKFDEVLGLKLSEVKQEVVEEAPQEIKDLAEARKAAKASKDYAKADELRREIEAKGWVVEDTKEGYRLLES